MEWLSQEAPREKATPHLVLSSTQEQIRQILSRTLADSVSHPCRSKRSQNKTEKSMTVATVSAWQLGNTLVFVK